MSNQGYFKTNMSRSPATANTYTAISGAAPQTVAGNTLSIPNPLAGSGNAIAVGSLAAFVVVNLTTNTLTVSGKWQVSADGSTWYNCATSPQNAAAVAIATGTGVLATTSLVVPASDAVYGWPKARFVLTTGVAAGGGAGVDEAAISYSYRVATAR
jgi:hypothetical protein